MKKVNESGSIRECVRESGGPEVCMIKNEGPRKGGWGGKFFY